MKYKFTIAFTFFFIVFTLAQTKIEMKNKNGVFTIPCIINGVPMDFVLDTGASNVVISTIEASFLYKQGLISSEDIYDKTYSEIADGSIIEGTTLNIKKIQLGNKIFEDIEALVLNNEQAPLLLGQTLLNKIGKYSIEDNYFIFNDDSISNKFDYETIELNTTNLRTIIKENEFEYFDLFDKYIIQIDSLKEIALKNNGEASFKLSEIYEKIYFSGSPNEDMLNYEDLDIFWYKRLKNEIIYWNEKAIELKYDGAYSKMAYFYYNHVEKSKKTLNYFILAYEKEKNYICASMISHLYIILNDKNEAFKWAFKAASFHGKSKWLSHNHTTMGDFYKNGIGTAKNINEALKWYIKDEEFLKIANIYYLGKDKPENIDEAVKYYKKVLDVEINYAKQKCECQNYDGYIQEMLYNNDAGWASYALCRIFYNKNNKNYNVKIALDYLKESANIYKNGLALRSLGKEYEIGLNFLKNEKKAFELYYESAIRNSDFGQYELGRCYLNGIGTDKNYNKAAHWFKLSHDNGNEEAKSMWDKYELWKYYEEIDENTKMEK